MNAFWHNDPWHEDPLAWRPFDDGMQDEHDARCKAVFDAMLDYWYRQALPPPAYILVGSAFANAVREVLEAPWWKRLLWRLQGFVTPREDW